MIREFEQADMEQVLKIWLEASIEAHDFISREFWESNVGAMRDTYLPAAETYVYEDEGAVKGFLSLFGDTIAALFVAPAHQGRGIGRHLINRAKDCRQRLNLTVYKENLRSVAFYTKCGFEVDSEQIDEHTGHPELVMVFDAERK